MAAPSSAAMALSRYGMAMPAQPNSSAGGPAMSHAKAKAVAEDFEAVFLSSMMNQMFASVNGDGPMGGNGATGVWRSFLADEYAKSFAKAGGVGIGAQVYRQLLQLQEASRT